MSKKDFTRGVEAAIKANTNFMHKQAEATAELGKRIVQKIDEQGKIIDVILDTLNEQEKKELYDLESEYDIADLGKNEKEVLVSFLLTLIAKYDQDSEEQKTYYFAVKKHLEVINPSDSLDLSVVENIDSRSELKAIFQTVCEFLFLKTGNVSFLDTYENELDSFGLTPKAIKEIIIPIEKKYEILGLRGIVEHYIPVETENEPDDIKEEKYLVLDWEADQEFCLQNGIEISKSPFTSLNGIAIKSAFKNVVFRNFPQIRTPYDVLDTLENCKFENCGSVGIYVREVQNCVFKNCLEVEVDDYLGQLGSIYITDCIFDNVKVYHLDDSKIIRSHFKNSNHNEHVEELKFCCEAAIGMENTEILDTTFENIHLNDDLFLFKAYGFCKINNCKFANIFTDRADMELSNYEETEGFGIFKTTTQKTLIDKKTCTGLDMINVIREDF